MNKSAVVLISVVFVLISTVAAIAGTVTRTVTWPATWAVPVPPAKPNLSTAYGAFSRGCSNYDKRNGDIWRWYLDSPSRKQHLGMDLAALDGTQVKVIADGRIVTYADGGSVPDWGAGTHGIAFVVHYSNDGKRYAKPFTAAYGHMYFANNPRTRKAWKPGDIVRSGEVIGTVRKFGTGAHLHFGMADGSKSNVAPTNNDNTSGKVNTPCVSNARGTVNPEAFLKQRKSVGFYGNIVGYKNKNGQVTSWPPFPHFLIAISPPTLRRLGRA